MIFKILWPIFHMFVKEFLEIKRDDILKIVIIIPVIQAIILGYVTSTDIKKLPTMICDEDHSALSRALIEKFKGKEYFNVYYFTASEKDIQDAFSRNKISLCIRIPEGFSKQIKKRKSAAVQVLIDGTMSNLASLAVSKVTAIIQNYSDSVYAKMAVEIQNVAGSFPKLDMEERVWYNPELRSELFMMPGVLGLLLVMVPMIVASLALVREKESGNIEQIMVTPIKPYQVVLGKILPYVLLSLGIFLVITVISLFLFKLPFRGDVGTYIFASIFMIIANLGIGILISTLCSTQQQAMLWDIFLIVPNLLLSGFIFPINNIPEILQNLTYFLPLRYYIIIIRGILLKNLSFLELMPQISALALFSFIIFFVAIKRFKKTVS